MTMRHRVASLLALTGLLLTLGALTASAAWSAPAAPNAVTPIALQASVRLAWAPVSGASSYTILRGTSPTSVTTTIRTGQTTTNYLDTTAANNTTYYYVVRAVGSTGTSPNSTVVSARPRARTCSTGNTVVVENCFPGTTSWKLTNEADFIRGGLEGFATATSIAAGGSVDLKVNATDGRPYHLEIYRTGWYGGTQGRLIGTINGLVGNEQPSCATDGLIGLIDCSGWDVTTTLQTTTDWQSGVYLIKLVTDSGTAVDNEILLTVRNDAATPAMLYDVPVATYQAYNNYGGRSLYDFNSDGDPTLSGGARAVKVSYDRPFQQPVSNHHDYYTRSGISLVSWLERQGYDMSYADDIDLERARARLTGRKVIVLSSHNEYVSAGMRTALTGARNAGTSIASFGANAMYQKIRFESSATSGAVDRTQVDYKSTESHVNDPSGIQTSTWRDPLRANLPENGLLGSQYVGDEANQNFPLIVTAAQGQNRFWRYTSLPNLASGTTAQIGFNIVGWEWDRRAANGQEPAGVVPLSASPVTGNILQDSGSLYARGSQLQESTIYRASSGAWVWNAATNNWARGLALDVDGVGEPDSLIQQATTNVLADMGQSPTTPVSGVALDASGALAIAGRSPTPGQTGFSRTGTIDVTFDRVLDPATVSSSQLQVLAPGGAAVPGTLTYDATAKRVRFTPAEQLNGFTTYTVRVGTGLAGWNGQGLPSVTTWTFTVGAGAPPTITSRTPASGQTGVSLGTTVTATFDRSLDPATVNSSTFTVSSAGVPVAGTVSYDAATRTVRFVPGAALASATSYTATLTTGIKAIDGTPLAAASPWSFTTLTALSVTGRTPAPLASGISTKTALRATFSRAVDPATLTSTTFSLKTSGGAAVPASVTYDASTRTATLLPTAPLLAGTGYTATLSSGILAVDGGPLSDPTTWTFTTSLTPVPAPTSLATTPADGATRVSENTGVNITFSQPVDPQTLTASSFGLSSLGVPIAGSVSYDAPSQTATFIPSAPLAQDTSFTARVTTAVRSTLGEPIAADITWSFTVGGCPCSLSANRVPEEIQKPVSDGWSGTGPVALEVGLKITVDSPTRLTALRYYRSPGEGGSHVGHLWTAGGAEIVSAAFTNETASGWQEQALPSPVTLQPGRTYILSVGLNDRYVVTRNALGTVRRAGPVRTVADGANGVFGRVLGVLPREAYANSDYFVDLVVESGAGSPSTPQIVSQDPIDGSSGVNRATSVRATFNTPLDPATVSSGTFTLRTVAGTAVPASVTYDEQSRTAKLVPTNQLSLSTSYKATLSTGVQAYDGTALASPTTWQFTTTDGSGPQVTSVTPVDDAHNISGTTDVRATFSQALNPATVTTATAKLETGTGAPVDATVSYLSATNVVVITPTAPLAGGTTYRATLTTGITGTGGTALPAAVSWTFATSDCPCSLFSPASGPAADQRPVQDGRAGAGPFSYEMGVKIQVTQAAQLSAIRFFKSVGETGVHTGTVWTAGGTKIAQVTFGGETGYGWQQQALTTPVSLTPGQTYVVSVGINDYYVVTGAAMASPIVNGPLTSVADGANDVFAATAGAFPTDSWNNSNYFIDAVVR